MANKAANVEKYRAKHGFLGRLAWKTPTESKIWVSRQTYIKKNPTASKPSGQTYVEKTLQRAQQVGF